MDDSELEQDAIEAEQLAPALDREKVPANPAAALYAHTPRWIWRWALFFAVLIFLYLARRILGPFIIAGVFAYIFSIVIDRIQERLKWPRILIVGVLYVIVLGALGTGLYFGAEAMYQQTRDFINRGPNILERGLTEILGGGAFSFGGQNIDAHSLADRINQGLASYFGAGGDGLRLATEVIGRLLDSVLVIIVSFYLLVDGKRLGAYVLKFVPQENRTRAGYLAGRIHTVLGAYLRGQLILIALMSVVSFIVLQFVFQVPYSLPLAILTGFLEILPLVGPAIAAVIAAGVALGAQGAGAAVGVIIAYTILREIEDQVVMPLVVGKIVELHPVATIFAVLAGGAVAGVLGMLLAVPAAAAIKVILDFVYPTDPKTAMVQARPGIRLAEREAESRAEEKSRARTT